ncbi:MAG: hypothetical protein JST85_26835, partial [Acidobacteria bacterium]|nr:hypothetical protein [Acidobacteriota bacterium]
MNDPNGYSFADGAYGGVKIVREHMDKMWNDLISPVLIRSDFKDRDTFIKGLFLRAFGWMKTLEKLDHVSNSQAILAGFRSLLEITVDLLFLHRDKTNLTGWKMYCWGQSEKLKGAEQLIQFYESRGLPLSQEHEPTEAFYKQEKLIIEDMRDNLWPNIKRKHPDRWSGKRLREDIREIDKYFEDELRSEIRA